MRNLARTLFLTGLFAALTFAQKTQPSPDLKIPPPIVPVKATAKPAAGGVVSGRKYTNETYNFEITFPENWLVPENYLDANIEERGYELRAETKPGVNLKTNAKVVEDIDRVKILLTAYRKNPGAANRAVLRVSVEDLTPLPQVKDAVDYFDLMRQNFKTMKLPADFKFSETNAERLGKKQFAFLDTSSNQGKKRMYATVRDGSALMFTLTYKSAEDLETLRQILTGGNFRLK